MFTTKRFVAAAASLAALLAVVLSLCLAPQHAHAKAASKQSGMGTMDMRMGPMQMSGTTTMGNKPYDVQCKMTPIGRSAMMKGM